MDFDGNRAVCEPDLPMASFRGVTVAAFLPPWSPPSGPRIVSTRPNIASGWHMEVVAAVVLGGVTITGGKGKILGVIGRILLLGFRRFREGVWQDRMVTRIADSGRKPVSAHLRMPY
jgi:hypothetical protein